MLLAMHTGQAVSVRWGSTTSTSFVVRNGVKQGGILSPVLFTLYLDMLLDAIKGCGVGCHMGRTFVGAVAYADDVAILAPTRSALKKMLSVAESAGAAIKVKFNPSKSQLLLFSPSLCSGQTPPITFLGSEIPVSKESVHLGHYIGCDRSAPPKLSGNDLTRRANILMSRFGHCTMDVKYRLFRTHCMAVYGSNLWCMSQAEPFFCAWRKCLRRLLHLPRNTHCRLLPPLVQDLGPEEQLHRRLLRFLQASSSSPNVLVCQSMQEVIRGSGSAVSDSLTILCAKYNLVRSALPKNLTRPRNAMDLDVDASRLRDFILLRERTRDRDIDFIIHYLATF